MTVNTREGRRSLGRSHGPLVGAKAVAVARRLQSALRSWAGRPPGYGLSKATRTHFTL